MIVADEGPMVDLSQRLDAMRFQEVNHYTVPDYLSDEWQQQLSDLSDSVIDGANDDLDSLSYVNGVWREKICEWFYQVVDHYEFSREVVFISMSYLDRYLATRKVNRRVFQLAAITALYVAIKLFEIGNFAVSSMTPLGRGYFTDEQIVVMEEIMLMTLNWRVHPPSPMAFSRDFMLLLSIDIPHDRKREIRELVRYLTELSVTDYWFISCKPSTIAIASILYAFEVLEHEGIENVFLDDFVQRLVDYGFDISIDSDMETCYSRLREMYVLTRQNVIQELAAAEEDHRPRIAIVTPMRELDVPGESRSARRAESPNSVNSADQSRPRKRKSLSTPRL